MFMKSLRRNPALLVVVAFAAHQACTSNPFGNEEIKRPDYKIIGGRLALEDNTTPDDIYVWLGGTAISTRTDRNGDFQLSLPPSGNNGAIASGGVFDLYFYVANYRLSSAKIVVQNDGFLFGEADLDAGGRLLGTRHLEKL